MRNHSYESPSQLHTQDVSHKVKLEKFCRCCVTRRHCSARVLLDIRRYGITAFACLGSLGAPRNSIIVARRRSRTPSARATCLSRPKPAGASTHPSPSEEEKFFYASMHLGETSMQIARCSHSRGVIAWCMTHKRSK